MNAKTDRNAAGDRRVEEIAAARSLPAPAARKAAVLALLRAWIDRRLLDEESHLSDLCWVGYRYMDAAAKTELFASMYYHHYIMLYAEQHPDGDADKKQPIDPVAWRNDLGVINALAKARCHADAHGLPYDIYLDRVMRGHLVGDKWKRPPRPNQLYGKLASPRARSPLTPTEVRERLYGPDWDARFRAEAYCGQPPQDQALSLLKQIIDADENPAATLAEYMCQMRVVTRDKAVDLFGEDLVHRAEALDWGEAVTSGAVAANPHLPACIGLINPSSTSLCGECPVSRVCATLSLKVDEVLVQTTGSDDPRRDWKRTKALIRQRRRRSRLKDEARDFARLLGPDSKSDDDGGSGLNGAECGDGIQ